MPDPKCRRLRRPPPCAATRSSGRCAERRTGCLSNPEAQRPADAAEESWRERERQKEARRKPVRRRQPPSFEVEFISNFNANV